ncbi:MAG: DUF420 domain-containing protein, partial [Acidobacteriaceae bacterium]
MPAPTSVFPTIDAVLNGITAVLLGIGRWQIAKRRIANHRAVMIAAFATSSAFLACYLTYHFYVLPHYEHVASVRFQHHGPMRNAYLAILLTHTILAALVVPLVLITLSRALKSKFALHKQIARWTWPVWMYVSITGVIVY